MAQLESCAHSLLEEPAQLAGCDDGRGLEPVALHIVQQALAELPGDNALLQVALEVYGALAYLGQPLEVAHVIEAHDDPREAFLETAKLLESEAGLAAIYVSTSNSIPVLRAVANARRTDGLAVVTTDVFPELLPHLRSGAVWATMYQRPLSQGRLAFNSLYRYLAEGKRPPDRIRLLPHVVMRSNLDLILEKLPIE